MLFSYFKIVSGLISIIKHIFNFLLFIACDLDEIFLRTKSATVGNRVVKSPRSDSSKSCFWIFCSIVYTPTKKKPYHEILCYLPVFRYLPSKSKLRRKSCNFLAAEGSTLNSNISGSVRILFNIFILV